MTGRCPRLRGRRRQPIGGEHLEERHHRPTQGMDGTLKVVPPLEPLAVRVILPRFLSEEERVQIADLASHGMVPTALATALGRVPSKTSRELRRNPHSSGQYRPFTRKRPPKVGVGGRVRCNHRPGIAVLCRREAEGAVESTADLPGAAARLSARTGMARRDGDDHPGDLPPRARDRPQTGALTAADGA